MSLEQEAMRGKRAQEVLDNEVYQDAHASVEAEIVRLWKASRDAKEREQLHALLGLHAQLRTAVEAVMRSGEIAAAELNRKRTLSDRVRAFAA